MKQMQKLSLLSPHRNIYGHQESDMHSFPKSMTAHLHIAFTTALNA